MRAFHRPVPSSVRIRNSETGLAQPVQSSFRKAKRWDSVECRPNVLFVRRVEAHVWTLRDPDHASCYRVWLRSRERTRLEDGTGPVLVRIGPGRDAPDLIVPEGFRCLPG